MFKDIFFYIISHFDKVCHGKDIETKFVSNSKETLEGLLNEIIVYPVVGKNRDNKDNQLGHKLKLRFELPVVGDELVYNDPKDKSKDYEVMKGKKTKDTPLIPIKLGGRPHIKKQQRE